MASISTVTTSVVSTPLPVSGVSTPESGGASTPTSPVFQETLTTQGRAFALGLGAPKNHGDIEALFAEVAEKFGIEQSKATDYSEAAEDAKRSTRLMAAFGNLSLFAGLDALITAEAQNVVKKTEEIKVLKAEISQLNAQKDALQAQYDVYRDEWNANTEQQFENAGEITLLGLELLGAETAKAFACVDSGSDACKDWTSTVNSLNSQIDALKAENAALFDRNLELDGLMWDLSWQIADLAFQIFGKETEVYFAELSIDASQAKMAWASALLDTFGLVLVPFTAEMALAVMRERSTASFEMLPEQIGLDNAIKDAVDNIAQQANKLGEIEAAKKALEARQASETALQDEPTTEPATEEGVPAPTTTLQSEMATRVGATALAVIDLLRQLLENGAPKPLDAPQETTDPETEPGPMDLIRQALEQTLPPGQGNPDLAASRAAGLAGALTTLQNILNTVASGEASMDPQVPGPSGRLTLAL